MALPLINMPITNADAANRRKDDGREEVNDRRCMGWKFRRLDKSRRVIGESDYNCNRPACPECAMNAARKQKGRLPQEPPFRMLFGEKA
ncbi:hypothetical protein [Croceicoccus sp. Ery15]|uniref:hypothetical protein n=1 Tax=Croceicoccus sp. Ery15 TaxID=1703338 RepID=UPI001E3BD127|nr:hypothetical protein [Croceicoccus sp. Ery15]